LGNPSVGIVAHRIEKDFAHLMEPKSVPLPQNRFELAIPIGGFEQKMIVSDNYSAPRKKEIGDAILCCLCGDHFRRGDCAVGCEQWWE